MIASPDKQLEQQLVADVLLCKPRALEILCDYLSDTDDPRLDQARNIYDEWRQYEPLRLDYGEKWYIGLESDTSKPMSIGQAIVLYGQKRTFVIPRLIYYQLRGGTPGKGGYAAGRIYPTAAMAMSDLLQALFVVAGFEVKR